MEKRAEWLLRRVGTDMVLGGLTLAPQSGDVVVVGSAREMKVAGMSQLNFSCLEESMQGVRTRHGCAGRRWKSLDIPTSWYRWPEVVEPSQLLMLKRVDLEGLVLRCSTLKSHQLCLLQRQ